MSRKKDDDLFSGAWAAKQAGMKQVEENADDAWKRAAARAVVEAARQMPMLTADDVMKRISSAVTTHDRRALGPVMRNAAKDGCIAKANRPFVPSRRKSKHFSPVQVWESLVFEGACR